MTGLRAAALIVAFAAAYLAGKSWWDDSSMPERPAHEANPDLPEGARPGAPARPLAAQTSSWPQRTAPCANCPALPPRPEDELLEVAMAEHRESMLLLREAIYHQLAPTSALAACGAFTVSHELCWLRFHCEVHAQLVELRVDRVDCGAPGRPWEDLPELEACVRDHLATRDPLGIPEEAAVDLRGYVGPVDVPWYVGQRASDGR